MFHEVQLLQKISVKQTLEKLTTYEGLSLSLQYFSGVA